MQLNLDLYMTAHSCFMGNIYICAYQVNTSGKYPFLQYIMQKNNDVNGQMKDTDLISFIQFPYIKGINVMEYCENILDDTLACYMNSVLNKNELDDGNNTKYKYKGFMNKNNDFYMFFDCSDYIIDTHYLSRTNEFYLVLIDELVNHKSICNFKIDSNATTFFIHHSEFMYLTNSDDFYIEVPIVAYKGSSYSMSKIISIFGVSPSDTSAIMGPYYYFTDYKKAIGLSGWTEKPIKSVIKITDDISDDIKFGLVRFAIFPGNMKVPANLRQDNEDESEITKNMLLLDNSYDIKNTSRISDRDASWTQHYDSVYIGKLKLDNGETYQDGPLWVLKEYDQQSPLTIHVVSKQHLKDVWTREDNYYIM